MPFIDLMPNCINRAKTQNRLDSSEARILENVDLNWMFGRMRRAAGVARANMAGLTNTIYSINLINRFDGSVGLIFHADTTIYLCYGDASAPINGGVVPLWTDSLPTADQLEDNGGTGNNMDEEHLVGVGVY